jgi:ankyrin repeat protein
MSSTLARPAEFTYTQPDRQLAGSYAQMRRLSVEDFYRARQWSKDALPGVLEGGFTALAMAAHIGHAEVVADLLERGCNPNGPSQGGWSAVHAAIHGGHLDVLRLLFDAGGDVNRPAEQGMTPLIQACILGSATPLIELLLAVPGLDLQRRDSFDCTALQYAEQKEHQELVDLLRQAVAQGGQGGRLH